MASTEGTGLDFGQAFMAKLAAKETVYKVRGIVMVDKRVYPLGNDTKVLSTVFEVIARPLVYEIADEHGLKVREARAQNYYPDFTLLRDEADPGKIAVDVKTTYRESHGDWRVRFTLGGYTSFIRNPTKNIEFPYGEYAEEWVIGYVYKRVDPEESPAHIYDLADLQEIPVPYEDVDVFVREKWRIAGDSAGSGDTYNIGSITGSLDDFRNGQGPFASKAEFLEYWRGYERTAGQRKGKYSNINEFRLWKQKPK